MPQELKYIFFVVLFYWLTVFVHELGHVLVGWSMGCKGLKVSINTDGVFGSMSVFFDWPDGHTPSKWEVAAVFLAGPFTHLCWLVAIPFLFPTNVFWVSTLIQCYSLGHCAFSCRGDLRAAWKLLVGDATIEELPNCEDEP